MPKVARRLTAAAAAIGVLISSAVAHADGLDEWNDAILEAIRRENSSPPLAARNLALVHLAIYEAINSARMHAPDRGNVSPNIPPVAEAAANAAAYRAAMMLFPSQSAAFEKVWRRQGAPLSGAAHDTNSVEAGFAAAAVLLEQRRADDAPLMVTYVPSAEPGAWRRTLPYLRPPELSHWGWLKPFAPKPGAALRELPPPPALTSREYAADFNEVKRLGARDSNARTPAETETARFWSDFTGTVTPPGHWNQIARTVANDERLEFTEKARLLALLNLAMADAGIVCWQAKYKFNVWRPVTAIHRAAEDGNGETKPDPDWQPLLVTPAFPEYVSGHSAFSGAAGEVLRRFFGRDNLRIAARSDSLPGVIRVYNSISTVVEEIGRSRILGGIHFPSADRAGQAAGREIGAHVFITTLRNGTR